MNPAEQKQHKKRTDELEQMITDLGTVVYARVDQAVRHADNFTREEVSKETNRRLELAQQQRSYVDAGDRDLRRLIEAQEQRLSQFKTRTFWQRLRWLFAGEEV